MNSYWIESCPINQTNKLKQDLEAEVCIIGAGIFGLTTAYYLSKRGVKVIVLEKDGIAEKTTGHTTAKITSQHGLIYHYLIDTFGLDFAKAYLEANQQAIENIESIIKEENISCNFETQDSYVYTTEQSEVEKIQQEKEAMERIGFPAEYVTETELPFSILAGLKFPNQAQFHPRKYLLSLISILERRGVNIFENSKVVDIKHLKDEYEVYINDNKITAKYLVMASHYPIKNFPGMYFIKMYQDSSYAIGVELEQEVFDGMYISCDTPATSFRNIMQDNGKKLLIVGGSSHKTGQADADVEDSYINLENYIKSIYPKAKIKYRWMTEDCISLDKIPYIGEFSNFLPNMYVATGYKKWGMTTSHVAAKIISDKILGIENPYENIYTATRLKPIKNSKEFGNMLKQSAYSLAINKLSSPIISYEELENDSGGVVDYKGEKLGIYKDKNGKMFAVVPYCKHLGCELTWNNLEKTWDCPCHGSRYDYTGKIITEPTTESLDIVDIE